MDFLYFILENKIALFKGLIITIELSLKAFSVSFFLSLLLSFFMITIFKKNRFLQALEYLIIFLTYIFRAIPFYIQLLIFYFIIPNYTPLNLSASTTGWLVLGICSASYLSQIISGAFNSISKDYIELSKILGLSNFQTFYYVLIPSVKPILIPAVFCEADQIIKSTVVISMIGVSELTRTCMNIAMKDFKILQAYLFLGLSYVLISTVLFLISRYVKRNFLLNSKGIQS